MLGRPGQRFAKVRSITCCRHCLKPRRAAERRGCGDLRKVSACSCRRVTCVYIYVGIVIYIYYIYVVCRLIYTCIDVHLRLWSTKDDDESNNWFYTLCIDSCHVFSIAFSAYFSTKPQVGCLRRLRVKSHIPAFACRLQPASTCMCGPYSQMYTA
jgi:hypothetical protein